MLVAAPPLPPPGNAATPVRDQGGARSSTQRPDEGAGHAPAASGASIPDVRVQRVLPSLSLKRPLQVVQAPGDDERLFILEQSGRVLTVKRGDREAKRGEVFLDIRKRVNDRNNEEGLLSMAFHPDFAKNREFFLYYTAEPPKRSVLSRFKASDDGSIGLPDTEDVLLTIEQPYWNHNGGTVCFGPDGMLYLGVGDGGAAGDPKQAGQDLGQLLAKILRIDVNKRGPGNAQYAIPPDNPFIAVRGARPEIWAYGMRNPWRMAFDRSTGELWVGDVGQNEWEEIDIVSRGGNYGWNVREGAHDFRGGKPGSFGADYIDPVAEYPRNEGISVTGGAVWRSQTHPSLNGVYIYGDFGSGRLWGIRHEPGRTVGPKVLLKGGKSKWSSIDQLNDGTIILTSMEGGERGPGALYEIVPVASAAPAEGAEPPSSSR